MYINTKLLPFSLFSLKEESTAVKVALQENSDLLKQ